MHNILLEKSLLHAGTAGFHRQGPNFDDFGLQTTRSRGSMNAFSYIHCVLAVATSFLLQYEQLKSPTMLAIVMRHSNVLHTHLGRNDGR